MLCGMKQRHQGSKVRRLGAAAAGGTSLDVSLHYGATTSCIRQRRSGAKRPAQGKELGKDKENLPTNDIPSEDRTAVNPQNILSKTSLVTNDTLNGPDASVNSRSRMGCLQKSSKHGKKGRGRSSKRASTAGKSLQTVREDIGRRCGSANIPAASTVGAAATGDYSELQAASRANFSLFSPPGLARSQWLADEDSYTGMSLSYASTPYTASMSSEAFDDSCSTYSESLCRKIAMTRAAYNRRCLRSARSVDSYRATVHSATKTGQDQSEYHIEQRPQPIGASDSLHENLGSLSTSGCSEATGSNDTSSFSKHYTSSASITRLQNTPTQDQVDVTIATSGADSNVSMVTAADDEHDVGSDWESCHGDDTVCLVDKVGQSDSGTRQGSSALRDEVFDVKSEQSNSSLTSHSSALFDRGQLRILVRVEQETEECTLHFSVLEAKDLDFATGTSCNSFVETQLLGETLEDSNLAQRSKVRRNTNCPTYDHHINIAMLKETENNRLLVSVYEMPSSGRNQNDSGCSKMMGCMSFKLKNLLAKSKKQKSASSSESVDSWYYLLPEEIGANKHLPVHARRLPLPPCPASGDKENQGAPKKVYSPQGLFDSSKATPMKVVIPKTDTGYGFTVKGAGPVRVGRVTSTSSSHKAGLHQGDVILRINGQDVAKKNSTYIARIVRESLTQIALDILRPKTSPPSSCHGNSAAPAQQCDTGASPRLVEQPTHNTQQPRVPQLPQSQGLLWQPQLSIINEELTAMEHNDTLLYNETGPKDASLLYNESKHASPEKWNPDLSCITHAADPKNHFQMSRFFSESHVSAEESNVYEEIDEMSSHWQMSSDEDNSALWQLPESLLRRETGFLGNQDATMETENSWANESEESDVQSMWSNATSMDSFMEEEQVCTESLEKLESNFVQVMRLGIQKFSRPLRHRSLLSLNQHATLFQNIEKLVLLSEFTLKELAHGANDAKTSINKVAHIYNKQLHMVCEAYQTYLSGLPRALTLLTALQQHNGDLSTFLQRAYHQDFQLSIQAFLEKPVQHLLAVVSLLEVTQQTCHGTQADVEALDAILAGLRGSVENATRSDRACQKTYSSSSLDSGISQCSSSASLSQSRLPHHTSHAHYKSSHTHLSHYDNTQLNGSSGYASMMGTSRLGESQNVSSRCSMLKPTLKHASSCDSMASVDQQLTDLEQRLHFPANIQPVKVAAPQRHLVFSGALQCRASASKNEVAAQGWLCNDLLLLTTPSTLSAQPIRMLASPVLLKHVQSVDFGADDSCDFSLTVAGPCEQSPPQDIHLSTSSVGDKFAWRGLLQHHLKSSHSTVKPSSRVPQSCFL